MAGKGSRVRIGVGNLRFGLYFIMKVLHYLKDHFPSAYGRMRDVYFWICCLPLRIVGRSRFLCVAYYMLFDRSFRREQAAVVNGIVHNMRHHQKKPAYFLLRRNIHRLEKGLSMAERKGLFALDYLEETVGAFERCQRYSSQPESDQLLRWANDVLHTYFVSVGEHPVVDHARDQFLRNALSGEAGKRTPCSRSEYTVGDVVVDYSALQSLSKRRRSVRWFQKRPVERELIDMALDVARQSPSSCNRQPFVYHVFDDSDSVAELASYPMGTRGFGHNIPVIIAVVCDLSAYFDARDRHGIYLDAGLSVMGFVYALETLGLASCTINWPDIEERERRISRFLGLQEYERVAMLVAVGYPDPEGLIPYSEKTAVQDLRRFNFE